MIPVKIEYKSEVGQLIYASGTAALGGALFGYLYGKLAHLPAKQVAKAWAVWHAAQRAILTFADFLIENNSSKMFAKTVISAVSTAIGMYELKKGGFIGNKMIFCFAAAEILCFCEEILTSHKKPP